MEGPNILLIRPPPLGLLSLLHSRFFSVSATLGKGRALGQMFPIEKQLVKTPSGWTAFSCVYPVVFHPLPAVQFFFVSSHISQHQSMFFRKKEIIFEKEKRKFLILNQLIFIVLIVLKNDGGGGSCMFSTWPYHSPVRLVNCNYWTENW